MLGGSDSLYRLGSDEFILLMERVESEPALYLTANRILAALKKPFTLEFRTIYVNASIGISRFPGDGDNPLELIRSADMAMHRAKEANDTQVQFFAHALQEAASERLALRNGLRQALDFAMRAAALTCSRRWSSISRSTRLSPSSTRPAFNIRLSEP